MYQEFLKVILYWKIYRGEIGGGKEKQSGALAPEKYWHNHEDKQACLYGEKVWFSRSQSPRPTMCVAR